MHNNITFTNIKGNVNKSCQPGVYIEREIFVPENFRMVVWYVCSPWPQDEIDLNKNWWKCVREQALLTIKQK